MRLLFVCFACWNEDLSSWFVIDRLLGFVSVALLDWGFLFCFFLCFCFCFSDRLSLLPFQRCLPCLSCIFPGFLSLSSVIIINAMSNVYYLNRAYGIQTGMYTQYPCILVSRALDLGFQFGFRQPDRLFIPKLTAVRDIDTEVQSLILMLSSLPGPRPWCRTCLDCSWLWHKKHGLLWC